jgi:hypothetical protein
MIAYRVTTVQEKFSGLNLFKSNDEGDEDLMENKVGVT